MIRFLSRNVINIKDINSGQIALPGGHVDNDENDFEAAIREAREEIGINLDEKSIYLGKLNKNFYVRKTKNNENLFVSVHIFILLD